MLHVDELVSGDGGGGSGGHPGLRAKGGMEQADGLVRAVTGDDGLFLSGAGAADELLRDVSRDVEGGVVEQLTADADHGGKLVRGQGHLAEGVVGLGDGLLLVDPGTGAVRGHDGDLVLTGAGLDDVHQAAHDVLFHEAVDELTVVR